MISKFRPHLSFLTTFGLLLVAIAGMFVADLFLAKTDRVESEIEAARLFREGQALMRQNKNKEAVDRMSDAIAIERNNRNYARSLALAQLAQNEASDAETTLTGLLNTDSTDGLANLIMARVLEKEGRFTEAVSYFHRAIYGQWKEDAQTNRRNARLELIDLLARQNAKEELLAELLPLQENAPQDLDTRLHLGQLFLRAGAPSRAAGVFRAVLREAPANSAAYRGMGEAEFALGDYRTAQRDFQAAIRIAPSDTASQHSLQLCEQLLNLDPTRRGLLPGERLRRSLELIQLARDSVSQCPGQESSPELDALLLKAAAALKARVTSARENDVIDANLDLAEQLWQLRKKACNTPTPTDSPLALILARLAR